MAKAWQELFEKNDNSLLDRVYTVFDKAYKQAHAKDTNKKQAGADDTAEKLEYLLTQDLNKYNFLDQLFWSILYQLF